MAGLLSIGAVGQATAAEPLEPLTEPVLGLVGGVTQVVTHGVLGNALETLWGDDDTNQDERASADGSWDAAQDLGSLHSLTLSTGAQRAWRSGVTGQGVTVAVIDTGVAPVRGLDAPGKLLHGPDLSYESQAAGTRYYDGYGHGTHMAGIVAGRDAGFDPAEPDAGTFAGVAPDARVLNMKVGTADGGVDVTQVIAALDWLVEHRDDRGLNLRVVNLAYGTLSAQSWQVDPLAHAVENAWRHGLVVVAAAGNDGNGEDVLMPARDPHVLTVGAVDHVGTRSTLDDKVASFSNGGDLARRPDVLAPGKSVVSLRVPNSYVDLAHPEGRVSGDRSERFLRGSGTSQATAVVAGQAALLLQADPSLTPDQVKAVLRSTSRPVTRGALATLGTGVSDVSAALAAVRWTGGNIATPSKLLVGRSRGTGTLEAARGGEHVVDPMTGDPLVGERDALGYAWQASSWASASSSAGSWVGGRWNGRLWTGTGWQDDAVPAVAWEGTSWNGVAWRDHRWSDAQWEARSWRGDSWKARSWRDDSWLARSWRGLP